MDKEIKIYEIGYLLNPLVPEEKMDEDVSLLRKSIEDRKGLILNEARPRMQRLAYPIKKFDTAYLGWIKFTADPEMIRDIKKDFEHPTIAGEKVIRFSITKTAKESAVPQSKIKKIIRKRPAAGAEEKTSIKLEEIDKKLEELLGKA